MDFSLLKQSAKKKRASIIGWRRLLHQNPEAGLDLPFTKKLVRTELKKMGLVKSYRQMDGGIMVDLSGKSGDRSSFTALRVDMDALPISEKTGLPYASSVEGCMHACGHDAHTAIGLGIVSILQELRSCWEGKIRIIFQSGEEVLKGAKLMLEQGVLDNPGVNAILGLHLDPRFPLMSVGLKPGQINAYIDDFSVSVKGRSAHGAAPHLSVDPVAAASFAVQAIQTIVSRNIPPAEPAVISIGEIKGGNVSNIIPDQVMLKGTIRSLSPEIRDLLFSRLKSVMKGLEVTFGIDAELSITSGSPPVICDEDLTEACILILKKILGEKSVVNIPSPQLGGDDFAYFAQKVPAVLVRLGCGKEGSGFPLHSSEFDFDEKVLEFGAGLFSYLLICLTGQNLAGRTSAVY